MPIYQVDIQKSWNQEYWTNVYYVSRSSLDDAVVAANAIMSAERIFTLNTVNFDKHRVSTVTEGDFAYVTTPINLAGQRSIGTNNALPLFNVIRVDLNDNLKRPGRKYYRGALSHPDISGQFEVLASTRTSVLNALQPLISNPGLTDRNGVAVLGMSVFQNIGMRQLRRGSRRRQTSII